MWDASAYCEGYEAALADKVIGIVASKACSDCHAILAGKDCNLCPQCGGVLIVTLEESAALYAQGYLDAKLGFEPAFTSGKIFMREQ